MFFGCETGQTIEFDMNEKIIIPKHYEVSKTSDPILIDGIDNEKVWDQAKYSDDFIDIEGLKIPTQKTISRHKTKEKSKKEHPNKKKTPAPTPTPYTPTPAGHGCAAPLSAQLRRPPRFSDRKKKSIVSAQPP